MAAERRFETEITIAATPDEVWRALTQPGELSRWFPLSAEVEPRPGGRLTWNWGGSWSWKLRIADWRPGERLLLDQLADRPLGADGQPVAAELAEPAAIALEFTLEGRQGATRLRLVHSGFGRGAAWDDEIDGITQGWRSELWSLRHYLERHRGRERAVGRAMAVTSLRLDEAFARLLGAEGVSLDPGRPVVGAPYTLVLPGGRHLSGTVTIASSPRQFAGTVAEANDGFVKLEVWRTGGTTGAQLWLSAWEPVAADVVRGFEESATALLARLLPSD